MQDVEKTHQSPDSHGEEERHDGSEDQPGDEGAEETPCCVPARYRLLGTGGYAKVYLDEKTREIVRYQKRYRDVADDTAYLDHSTMLDLAVTQGFNTCEGMPYLHRYEFPEEEPDYLVMRMRDHGISLHEVRKQYWSGEIAEHLATILRPVVQCCTMLYDNGIQHTDIKPTNVLVTINLDDEPENGTLIDFNSVSLYVAGRDGKPYWTHSIGTWSYIAPEILNRSRPEKTSMSWSLGVLICYMLGWHPYEYYSCLKKGQEQEPTSRSFWSGLLKKRRQQSNGSERLVFSSTLEEKLRKHDPFWLKLVQDCLIWDPARRPSIHHVFVRIASRTQTVAYSTRFYPNYIGNPAFFEGQEELRRAMVDRIYEACDKINDPSAFVRAVSYLDRVGPSTDLGVPIDACCLVLAWMLENRYVLDDSISRRALLLLWPGLPIKHPQAFYEAVLTLADRLGWRLLQITADVTLAATWRPRNIHALLHAYLRDCTEPYTQRALAHIISANLPHPLSPEAT